MRILVDTHTLLWSLGNIEKLSLNQRNHLLNPSNEVFASQISFMEITIKMKLGKLSDYNLTVEQIA